MKILKNVPISLCLTLIVGSAMFSPRPAHALLAQCAWFESAGSPWLYSDVSYSSLDATTGVELQILTQLTQPISDSALDYWVVSPSGGSAGHQLEASVGPTYSFSAYGAIGYMSGGTFYSSIATDCSGNFQFNAPTNLSVNISPATVNVGDPVTITWSSQDADSCLFDGAPIATGGTHNFLAALSDSRSYVLQCSNNWGSSSASATLTVN
ncbi:MAG: hypothetical protein WD071_07360 [Pseudohongiella sp.]|uniref:hypothetical protein n=1 Tax=Pseudohongiella sp. TaxID=1979412 RepID=UPI00349FFD00